MAMNKANQIFQKYTFTRMAVQARERANERIEWKEVLGGF